MTHVGLLRTRNEDTVVIPGLFSVGSLPTLITVRYPVATEPLAFAVIDGMGGHRGGQEASRLVAQHLLEHPNAEIVETLSAPTKCSTRRWSARPS